MKCIINKKDFTNMVADCFENLTSDEAINIRAREMIQHIEIYTIKAKEYLKHGIL